MSVLSIGTTHPHNVAGVGRDLVVGAHFGVNVMTVVAAVSAQGDRGIVALESVSDRTFAAQLACLQPARIDAIRIGALTTPSQVAVAATFATQCGVPCVIDPVLGATRGGAFADADTVDAMRAAYFAMPNAVVTPNLPEAAAFLGRELQSDDADDAARELVSHGARAVLLKGGHARGDSVVDVLATSSGLVRVSQARATSELRGSGCTLAMALACTLAKGSALETAVRAAIAFTREARSAMEAQA